MAQFNFTTTTRHEYTDGCIEERAFHIPSAIVDCEQWITFRLEEDDDGKVKKKPCSTEVTDGDYGPYVKYSGVRSPENFTDYMSAIEFVETVNRRASDPQDSLSESETLDGVGFVFTEDDDFVGIDLDGCVDSENRIKQFANTVLGSVNSFAEFSPSGTGLHVIAKGSLDDDYQNRNDDLGLEMYESGRFFTVTGSHIRGTNKRVTDCTGDVREVQREFMDEDESWDALDEGSLGQSESGVTDAAVVKTAKSYSDKFTRLYEGGGPDDTSRGDLSFVRQLSFWCGEDAAQMKRIWLSSGRVRAKLQREDYVENTIATAIASNDDTFSGTYK